MNVQQSDERLSSLRQAAQRFIDDVSHEIRAPLTVIRGYTEALIQKMAGPLNQQQNEFLGHIAERAQELSWMLDELLDSSNLRAGKLRIDRAPQRLEEILAPCWPILHPKAGANKIELVKKIPPNLPEVFADAEKAGRVVVNLVVESIKRSPENGRVVISAREDDEGGVKIEITDNGREISTKRAGKLGLGLSLARELAALNLGEVNVASELGNSFSFTLAPNDRQVILQRYFSYLQSLTDLPGTIAAMRIAYRSQGEHYAKLRNFATSAVAASDLVLRTPEDNSILVIGCCDHPEKWAQTLEKRINALASQNNSPDADSIVVEMLGERPFPLQRDEFLDLVLGHVQVA